LHHGIGLLQRHPFRYGLANCFADGLAAAEKWLAGGSRDLGSDFWARLLQLLLDDY
jgi:hypothetical protein